MLIERSWSKSKQWSHFPESSYSGSVPYNARALFPGLHPIAFSIRLCISLERSTPSHWRYCSTRTIYGYQWIQHTLHLLTPPGTLPWRTSTSILTTSNSISSGRRLTSLAEARWYFCLLGGDLPAPTQHFPNTCSHPAVTKAVVPVVYTCTFIFEKQVASCSHDSRKRVMDSTRHDETVQDLIFGYCLIL